MLSFQLIKSTQTILGRCVWEGIPLKYTYESIRCDVKKGVMTITLDRPEHMNAFTVQMANELVDVFTKVNGDDEVRVVVVTGSGKAFCAGMDLSVDGNVFGLNETLAPSMNDMDARLDEPEIFSGVRDTGGRVVLSIYDCTKPVIGAINGAAVGIGATMTLPMDIRLVSDQAKYGFVFNKIGIVPEACSSWFLPRIVGISQALEWCYTGEFIDAETAVSSKLAKASYESSQLLEAAYGIAERIASSTSPVAIALTRQMMYRNGAASHPIEAHKVDSLSMFYTSIGDGKEGVSSFLEKRKADFKKKVSEDMPDFYPWW